MVDDCYDCYTEFQFFFIPETILDWVNRFAPWNKYLRDNSLQTGFQKTKRDLVW